MALARLALRSMQQRVVSPSAAAAAMVRHGGGGVGESVQRERWNNELLKRFMGSSAAANEEKKEKREISVNEKKRSKLFPWRKSRKTSLWRDNDVPALYEFFPSGLGNALLQATENINRLMDKLNITPMQLMGSVREEDDRYKLRYEVPGLGKDELKITIEDGVLNIKGEHKEEEEERSDGDDDDSWSSRRSYGYYNTSLVLPDDAKVDDIKAELKDGVLHINIPRTQTPKKDVKQVQIH